MSAAAAIARRNEAIASSSRRAARSTLPRLLCASARRGIEPQGLAAGSASASGHSSARPQRFAQVAAKNRLIGSQSPRRGRSVRRPFPVGPPDRPPAPAGAASRHDADRPAKFDDRWLPLRAVARPGDGHKPSAKLRKCWAWLNRDRPVTDGLPKCRRRIRRAWRMGSECAPDRHTLM